MVSPLVSICIPCYNAMRWLPATLESALEQSWPNCEIIVVDDGSSDDTLTAAQAFAGRGVRIVAQANAGAAAARNHAARLATGDYIKFLDADDLLSPDMVARQMAALRSRPNAIAYGEWCRFHDDPAKVEHPSRIGWHDAPSIEWLLETWADAQPMMQCGQYLIPRAVHERAGPWNEQLSLIDDFEYFTRLTLASAEIVFTPGARLYYRSGFSGSLSDRRSARAWQSAYLARTLGVAHLLQAEDSQRTRAASAVILQGLVYDMYPNMPSLIKKLETRIAELGGCSLAPLGGRGFLTASRIVGWKTARWLQVAGGKFPRPLVR